MSNPRTSHRAVRLFNRSLPAEVSCLGLIFLLSILLALSACKKKPRGEETLSYPLETAQLVSHVTSGVVGSREVIRVRFVSPVIAGSLVGQNVRTPVFRFDPEISGITRWEDTQTLVFQPGQPLPFHQQYEGELNLRALLPAHAEEGLEPLRFRFEVAGREILSLIHDFRLEDPNDPERLRVVGSVEFSSAPQLEEVRAAAGLTLDDQQLPLDWQEEPAGGRFSFSSAVFRRTSKVMDFELALAAKSLEMSNDFREAFQLPPLTALDVTGVRTASEGERLTLEIEFSDELDPNGDVRGLVALEPPVEMQLKVMGRKLFAEGDFAYGGSYQLTVHPGIRSRFGTTLEQQVQKPLSFPELKPQLKFASDGVFLPSANLRRIRFLTLNLSRVRVEIKRVFENNLGQFLQTEQLASAADRREGFYDSYVSRVGVVVYSDTLEIGPERNIWRQNELDLSRIISSTDQGLYLLAIRFEQRDMLYGQPELFQQQRYYYGEDYSSNPYSPGYIYAHGQIYKPVLLSDIGLTYIKGHDRHLIYATRIADAAPLAGVTVQLKTYQNQVIATRSTGTDGLAEFTGVKEEVFYVEAQRSGQRSVIKLNEMGWNLSTFETGGVEDQPQGTRAFIYTERGVYRPGDDINLCLIARNDEGTFPRNHPVTLKVFNPRNQKVYEETQRESLDGFYHWLIRTNADDPTGNWRADALVGSRTISATLKIETVVPLRLKVNLQAAKTPLSRRDRALRATLSSTYLFGNPAAGLRAEVNLRLRPRSLTFAAYPGFVFSNETMEFRDIEQKIFDGVLSVAGTAEVQWQLPALNNAPSALAALLTARVYEKGGRANPGQLEIPINPFDSYVGLQKPQLDYGYTRVGQKLDIPVILIDPAGKALAGQALKYRIYKGTSYWWWEYDERDQYVYRFKSHEGTELLQEGSLISQSSAAQLSFTPDDDGSYFVEVQQGSDGHSAGFFINAYTWGRGAGGGKDAGAITLKTDRDHYRVGDQALIRFPTPEEGAVLFTVARGKRILSSRWLSPAGGETETRIYLPVTAEMIPNSYVSVSIIQPHAQTLNDRPLRMYGVVPLNVEDPATHQPLRIKMADELQSNQNFQVAVETADGKPTQLTIAVVDEGLLNLTRFPTPDPWAYFFQKLRLGVETYDLFSYVIGANKGDVFKTFSIGGGFEEAYRAAQLEPPQKKRFQPVSIFQGPLLTDERGHTSLQFNMPNYVGSVRVMAVAANGERYAMAEKTVPVKTDLMLVASLPRVIGPGDRLVIPATVITMKEGIGPVTVQAALQGPLKLSDAAAKQVSLPGKGETDVFFEVTAGKAVGPAHVLLTATGSGQSSRWETDIEVRASSPRIFETEEKMLQPGQTVSMIIPGRGLPGSNHARVSIRKRPNLDFSNRLYYLIRYPYGCIEQVVSAAFPQLYLKDFLPKSGSPQWGAQQIDRNINRGIAALRRYQLSSGGFTYWPGASRAGAWVSNYAGHFMVEARKLGYHVPDDLFNNWLRYQQSQALTSRDDLMTRVYRAYLLCLAGEPSFGALNLLRENNLKEMTDTEKWLLAGAYRLAGAEATAGQIRSQAGLAINEYWEFSGTYGSTLRDKAIITAMLTEFEEWETADRFATELAARLVSDDWLSTQSAGFMLMAVGKYLRALEGNTREVPLLSGEIVLPNGRKVPFNTQERIFSEEITEGFGREVRVSLSNNSTVQRAFVALSWDGLPITGDVPDEEKNLRLKVEWLNEDGQPVNVEKLSQGSVFWGHFRVENPDAAVNIEEVALLQVLPAGWEIENTRLSGEERPSWMSGWRLNGEEYQDIRDDRVMWFFDLPGRRGRLDFAVKLNTVTVGTFHLPPTVAEAMYNQNYKATRAGGLVTVEPR